MYFLQVKGLVAQLIQVKDVSTATGLEVTAGGKVGIYNIINNIFNGFVSGGPLNDYFEQLLQLQKKSLKKDTIHKIIQSAPDRQSPFIHIIIIIVIINQLHYQTVSTLVESSLSKNIIIIGIQRLFKPFFSTFVAQVAKIAVTSVFHS